MGIALILLLLIIVLFLARLAELFYYIFATDCSLETDSPLRTIFCIGSGGHTTEMMRLVQSLDKNKYKPRQYVLAANDIGSNVKIIKEEIGHNDFRIIRIPRIRNVGQSLPSAAARSLYATLCSIVIVWGYKPHVIFCNGPGTCVPVCVAAFILRFMFLIDCRIVFIESVCRVRTLSLTGKILQYFVDIFIVQWPELRDICFRAKYFGRLT